MTTLVYNNARLLLGTAQMNWPTANVWCALINNAYFPSANDVYLSAVPRGNIVAEVAVTGLAITKGVCTCTVPTFSALLSTSTVAGILLYIKGASDAVSPLVYYSSDTIGLPFTPQGFNYTIAADQSANGFFQA